MNDHFAGWIARQAAQAPARIALRYLDEVWTYRDLDGLVARLSGALNGPLALPCGARVAYLGANTPELIALLFACAGSGQIFVPLNWRLAAAELDTILHDCAAEALIVEDSCIELAARLHYEVPNGRRYGVRTQHAAWQSIPTSDPIAAESTDPNAAILIAYTSGTTGRPKGAMYTATTFATNARNAVDAHRMTPADRVLTSLPLFHTGGLNIQTTPALALGAEVVLQPRFDPAATLAAIVQARPSLTVQVPATLQALQALPAWRDADLSSLRAIATGSTDVPRELLDTWQARGIPVIQIYGATETGPVSIYQRVEEAFATTGSIGRQGQHTEIRITRSDGTPCDTDEPGEIWVRGGHVVTHYWNDRHTESFVDGWFKSGDIAACDAQGLYWFVDRIKNVIISGGENIYPAEIERVLRGVPELREAAVVGEADAQWGAVPVAVVVPQDVAHFEPSRLNPYFDGVIARYKWPKRVRVVNALPRTALGKVDIPALKALLEKESK